MIESLRHPAVASGIVMKTPTFIKNNIALIFIAVCWLLLTTQITAFNMICSINDYSLIGNILMGASESLLLLSPYLIISRKWRWTVIFSMIIIPVFLFANALYLRWFPDLMTFAIIANGASNATGTVAEGAFSCIKSADLWIIIPLIIFIICYICCVKKISQKGFPFMFKAWSIIGVCTVFFLQQLAILNIFAKDLQNNPNLFKSKSIDDVFFYHRLKENARRQQMHYYGLLPYIGIQSYELLRPKYIKLTPEEITQIETFLEHNNSAPILFDSLPDNSKKNLILIVVESLNSDALNVTVNSRPIMPYLTSLLQREKGVIRMDSVLSQVGIGRSSDGRFIYQTGLLPITDNPIALKFIDYPYPSLSEALNRKSIEFDCGDPIQWNKIDLSKKYGFSQLYTREAMVKNMKKLGGKDPALFNNALPVIEKLSQPFYVALNTMDMHDPYNEYGWKHTDLWQDSTFSENEKIYMEKCRQFDAGLSQFIAGLKKAGIYDNSIIVITGDHNARPNCLNGNRLTNTQIPLIILNSGIDLKSNSVIGQSDLYPTLLDLMGVSDYQWRGVGKSIFRNPAVTDSSAEHLTPLSYPSPEAWQVSDLIIRSAYHRNLHSQN